MRGARDHGTGEVTTDHAREGGVGEVARGVGGVGGVDERGVDLEEEGSWGRRGNRETDDVKAGLGGDIFRSRREFGNLESQHCLLRD